MDITLRVNLRRKVYLGSKYNTFDHLRYSIKGKNGWAQSMFES